MRRTHLLALGFLLAACRPNPELAELPAPEAAAPQGPTLADYAAQIDPGPQPMLTEGLPPWMFEMLGLEASPADPADALLRRSAKEQAEFDAKLKAGIDDNVGVVLAIRSIARSVVLAEQAAAKGGTDAETLARLERVYAAVDVPMLAGDRNAFGTFITLFAEAAAAEGAGPSDAGQLQQLAGVVQAAVRAAGPLHRHTVAELVRSAPEHPAVPTALLAAAKAKRGTEEAWPVAVARLAVNASSSPEQQLDLARVCYAALEVDCGDQALAAAGNAKGIEGVRESGALAKRIVALADASDLEPRLERARAQLALGRFAAARAELEALRRAAPNDARPVAGLAKLAIETELDFIGASKIIDDAGPLQNADEAYYEIALGTRATAAMATTIPQAMSGDRERTAAMLRPVLERTQRDAEGYAALGNPDGRFLSLVLDVGESLLDQYVETGAPSLRAIGDLTSRIVALQSQIPDHGHTYRLLMSATVFEPDRARAIAAAGVLAPGGPEHDALSLRRARALCDLAVTWTDAELAGQCLQEAQTLARSQESMLMGADATLTVAQLSGRASWVTVAETYDALLDDDMTPEDARALNNVAMALWQLGKHETAINAWNLSAQLATEWADVPQLNLALARTADGSPEAIAAVQAFTNEGGAPGVKLVALAWLKAWAKGKKAKTAAEAALAAAIESEAASAMRPTAPDPYAGLLLQGTLKASFAYTTQQGLQIQLDASGRPWAVMAPPR